MRVSLPPWVLALFDDPPAPVITPPAPTPPAPTPPAPTPPAPTTPAPTTPAPGVPRNDNGQFQSLEEAQRRIKELNEENASRRHENAANKKQMDALSRNMLRTSVRAALSEAGAVHPDVLDIFLSAAGDKVKLDEDFQVVGVAEALTAFKESHAVFFKTPDPNPQPGGRPNSTAQGGSPAGGTSGGAPVNTMGLPDLTKLASAEERRKALKDWKATLRRREARG